MSVSSAWLDQTSIRCPGRQREQPSEKHHERGVALDSGVKERFHFGELLGGVTLRNDTKTALICVNAENTRYLREGCAGSGRRSVRFRTQAPPRDMPCPKVASPRTSLMTSVYVALASWRASAARPNVKCQ